MKSETRVEVVPDNDADADPRIPKDVLVALGPDAVLTNGHMMYIRAAKWERVKYYFPFKAVER
jgi:hypothetical protein